MPTSSRRTAAVSQFSEGRWASELPLEPPLHPTELQLLRTTRSWRIKRALLALAGFLIATGIGVAATLVWQSHGDTARRTLAQLSPRLEWLAPPAPSVAPAEPGAPFAASRDQLGAISHSLAVVRQSLDKLASDIAKLQAAKQDAGGPDIRVSRTSAPPPAGAVPGRKVVTPASQQQPPAR
jgi:hypothetical protein